jgi:hypothetical protein
VRRRRIELPVNECVPGRRASIKRKACATSVAVVSKWCCCWVVPGPGPDDRRQTTDSKWVSDGERATILYECRERCRTATSSVSQADLANGLANRSRRAVYLSETRSDVRSSGARSRLREMGRAGRVKMYSRCG